jgi:predicted NACHT family NTPase
MSDFDYQPYLDNVVRHYEQWWKLYTLTDVEGRQREPQGRPFFDFGLMVQSIVPKNDDLLEASILRTDQPDPKTKSEQLEVLTGLRKYAADHVLLVGRPGSGKSTALARLMLEAATDLLTDLANGQSIKPASQLSVSSAATSLTIPVLVELRYWQGSISQLILNALARHGLPITAEQLEPLLAKSLLLFDGVNELPSEEARSQLSAFRRNHPRLPMIFTTRDLSLGGDLGIEQKLEMQPLTVVQMQAFVRAYVPEQAEEMLRQLKDRLQELGQTPLLLWMLCGLFQQTGAMPENLGLVFRLFTQGYENSSMRIYEIAALKGDVRPLSDRRLWKPALKKLASVMMTGNQPTDFRVVIERNEAELTLRNEDLIRSRIITVLALPYSSIVANSRRT